jgi:small subunit ribosomal protein S6
MKTAYELMIILKPLLPEDIRSGIEKRLNSLVKKLGGDVKSSDVWGKKHLAYKIGSHEEGYYIVYDIDLPGENLKEFDTELKLFNDIIRFLITKKDNQ